MHLLKILGVRVSGAGFRDEGVGFGAGEHHPRAEREFFIDNLLVRIH
jgi:hypothetical protein